MMKLSTPNYDVGCISDNFKELACGDELNLYKFDTLLDNQTITFSANVSPKKLKYRCLFTYETIPLTDNMIKLMGTCTILKLNLRDRLVSIQQIRKCIRYKDIKDADDWFLGFMHVEIDEVRGADSFKGPDLQDVLNDPETIAATDNFLYKILLP